MNQDFFDDSNYLAILMELQRELHETAKSKGFWDKPRNFGEAIALIIEELSDAFKSLRLYDLEERDRHVPELGRVEVKLADAVIRIFDLAGGFNLRVAEALMAKKEANKGRPYMHGKRF